MCVEYVCVDACMYILQEDEGVRKSMRCVFDLTSLLLTLNSSSYCLATVCGFIAALRLEDERPSKFGMQP